MSRYCLLLAASMLLGCGGNDDTANRQYIKEFVLRDNAELGRKYGLAYAEQYHYIGPESSPVDDYVKQHAVPL